MSDETAAMAIEEPIEEDWESDQSLWRSGEVWSEVRTAEEDRMVMRPFEERMGDYQRTVRIWMGWHSVSWFK